MEGNDHFIHQQCVLCSCALYRQEDKFLWLFLNSWSEQQQKKIHLILWLPWLNGYPCSLDTNPSITIKEQLLTPGGQLSFFFHWVCLVFSSFAFKCGYLEFADYLLPYAPYPIAFMVRKTLERHPNVTPFSEETFLNDSTFSTARKVKMN